MEHSDLLRDLLILFGFATVVSAILHRARQSTIVAYLLTGMLVGPSGLGLVANQTAIKEMAEIGVALLLFTIGIEFSLKKLARMRNFVLGAGSRQVALTIAAVFAIALLWGSSWRTSLFWGFLVAASSTAIVLKLLHERQELDTIHGRAIVGVLLFQDLCVVPMMALVPALNAASANVAITIALALFKALAVVALILFVAHTFFPFLWRRIVQLRNKEIFLIACIFFSLGTAWGATQLGLSLALGAFLAGLALSESEFAHQILSDILPFRDGFSSIFFISIGMLIDLAFLWEEALLLAGLGAGILALKALTGGAAVATMGFSVRMSLPVGLGLAQVGEFSFVLLQQGADLGLVNERSYQTFLAAAVLTMMLTPLLLRAATHLKQHLPERGGRTQSFGEPEKGKSDTPAAPLADHVILCGYGLNGRLTAHVLRELKIPYRVLETNPETVRRAGAEGETISFGDGSSPGVLERAGIARARAIIYAISDPFVLGRAIANARTLNPALAILVRTKRLEDRPMLEDAGASHVVPEELEAAEELIIEVLRLYGMARKDAFEHIQQARNATP